MVEGPTNYFSIFFITFRKAGPEAEMPLSELFHSIIAEFLELRMEKGLAAHEARHVRKTDHGVDRLFELLP
jgi:hypothetical protein